MLHERIMIIYLLLSRLRILGDKTRWFKFIKLIFFIILLFILIIILCIIILPIQANDESMNVYLYRLIIILLSWHVRNRHGDQKFIGDNSHLSVFLNDGEKNGWFSNTVIYFWGSEENYLCNVCSSKLFTMIKLKPQVGH